MDDIKNGSGEVKAQNFRCKWHQRGENIVIFQMRHAAQGIVASVTRDHVDEVTPDLVKWAVRGCFIDMEQNLQWLEEQFASKIDEWFTNPQLIAPQQYHFSPE